MKSIKTSFLQLSLILMLLFAVTSVQAKGVAVGQQIELNAKNKKGVPLHKEAKSSMMGRAKHGSKATVLAIKKNWYQIKLEDGKTAWIVKRYIAKGPSAKQAPAKTPAKKAEKK